MKHKHHNILCCLFTCNLPTIGAAYCHRLHKCGLYLSYFTLPQNLFIFFILTFRKEEEQTMRLSNCVPVKIVDFFVFFFVFCLCFVFVFLSNDDTQLYIGVRWQLVSSNRISASFGLHPQRPACAVRAMALYICSWYYSGLWIRGAPVQVRVGANIFEKAQSRQRAYPSLRPSDVETRFHNTQIL